MYFLLPNNFQPSYVELTSLFLVSFGISENEPIRHFVHIVIGGQKIRLLDNLCVLGCRFTETTIAAPLLGWQQKPVTLWASLYCILLVCADPLSLSFPI